MILIDAGELYLPSPSKKKKSFHVRDCPPYCVRQVDAFRSDFDNRLCCGLCLDPHILENT